MPYMLTETQERSMFAVALKQILGHLEGISRDDFTYAELQIVNIAAKALGCVFYFDSDTNQLTVK